ncbi:MAG: hypothetical protein PQJ49_03060, partial [Sphaerochaetaceae bacterium]|nr:hypothetical protein [Sphaerochaetaceae bacterium]
YVYKRCKQSKEANHILVITSLEKSDDELYEFCCKERIPVFRGDLDNVLKRYLDASISQNLDIICRVCGDSPFVDVEAIDQMFLEFSNSSLEYITTVNVLNGFISEVFTLDLLQRIYNMKLTKEDKEHVTKYIRDNKNNFKIRELDLNLRDENLKKFTLTIDYPIDLEIAQNIVSKLDDFKFNSKDVMAILSKIKEVK